MRAGKSAKDAVSAVCDINAYCAAGVRGNAASAQDQIERVDSSAKSRKNRK
jgi:hypothetical protein